MTDAGTPPKWRPVAMAIRAGSHVVAEGEHVVVLGHLYQPGTKVWWIAGDYVPTDWMLAGRDYSNHVVDGEQDPSRIQLAHGESPTLDDRVIVEHRVQDQPPPVPNDQPKMWDLVIEDMRERDRIGTERYGTPLQPFNGRDPLVDGYQEALDMVVYWRQAIAEREALVERLATALLRVRAGTSPLEDGVRLQDVTSDRAALFRGYARSLLGVDVVDF